MTELAVTWVCSHCGSDEVYVGAYAGWDNVHQRWVFELHDASDGDFCAQCGDSTITEKPITDTALLAKIAIAREERADGIPE